MGGLTNLERTPQPSQLPPPGTAMRVSQFGQLFQMTIHTRWQTASDRLWSLTVAASSHPLNPVISWVSAERHLISTC